MSGIAARAESVLLPTYPERPLALVRGCGSTVWDDEGKAYLDLAAGLATTSLGHGHPAAAQALAEQTARLGHVSNLFYSEPQVLLADRLRALSGLDRVFFCNSGAEAVEAAIKLGRRAGKARGGEAKHEVVCVEGSFHGRTLGTLAAGYAEDKRAPFAPVPAGFRHVPRNDVGALAAAVGPQTAAVLLEPIQGEGGVLELDAAFLLAARELCDRHGALLLLDEVQTGIGRCGAWFAFQLLGVAPDAIALAKGLGGGLPIGALVARDLPDGFRRGDHGSTFGGSPPLAAAALAVLDAIEREGLVENAAVVGGHLAESLAAVPGVTSVRGAGLLLAAETEAPAAVVAASLRERGVIVAPGTATAIRLCPPLSLSQREADAACDALAATLSHLHEGVPA